MVVLVTELVKLLLNLGLEINTARQQPQNSVLISRHNSDLQNYDVEESLDRKKRSNSQQATTTILYSRIREALEVKDLLKMCVPAFLYLIQNNLMYLALTNLSVPLYEVANQGKILATAVCGFWIMGRSLTVRQTSALFLLASGIVIAQLADYGQKVSKDHVDEGQQSRLLGLIAMFISCFTSGLAGVYFEWMLKTGGGSSESSSSKSTASSTTDPGQSPKEKVQKSVYVRNMQLALPSLLISSPILFQRKSLLSLYQGYDWLVWLIISSQAMTGLLIAFVMKYADSTVKVMAVSLSVIVASGLSSLMLGESVNVIFMIGAIMVVSAQFVYGGWGGGGMDNFKYGSSALTPSKRNISLVVSTVYVNLYKRRRALAFMFCLGIFYSFIALLTSHRKVARYGSHDRRKKVPIKGQSKQSSELWKKKMDLLQRGAQGYVGSCPKPKVLDTYIPTKNDVQTWMQLQRMDGPALIEDRHDQYALTGHPSPHRLDRLVKDDNAIDDDADRKETLLQILRHVNDEFVALNITYTLWAGTLLGAYRHHTIIPWDDDVDIAISSEDTDMLRKVMIERAKLDIHQRYDRDPGSILLQQRNMTNDVRANAAAVVANETLQRQWLENGPSTKTYETTKAKDTPYQWVMRASRDSDIIIAKVADLRNGYFIDIFTFYRNGENFVTTFFKPPRCFPVKDMIPSIPCVLGSHIYECARNPQGVLKKFYPKGLGIPKEGKNWTGIVYEGTIAKPNENMTGHLVQST